MKQKWKRHKNRIEIKKNNKKKQKKYDKKIEQN